MAISKFLDRPIAFHVPLVDLTGSITGALMLSQALYWTHRTKDEDGWFYKTQVDWYAETRMSRREQESARKRLSEIKLHGRPLWQEALRGVPATMHYRLDLNVLDDLLLTGYRYGIDKLDCTEAPNQFAQKRQSSLHAVVQTQIEESETTTETTTVSADSDAAAVPAKLPRKKAPPSDQSEMFGALAELCQLDQVLNKGMLAKTAADMLKAGYKPAQVQYFGKWWIGDPWRREHRPIPNISDLRTHIITALQTYKEPVANPYSLAHVED